MDAVCSCTVADASSEEAAVSSAMLAISVLGAALAVSIGRNLSAKLGGWYAALAGVGIYLVVVLVALGGQAVNPAVHRGIILVCAALIAVMGVSFLLAPLRDALRPRAARVAEET